MSLWGPSYVRLGPPRCDCEPADRAVAVVRKDAPTFPGCQKVGCPFCV